MKNIFGKKSLGICLLLCLLGISQATMAQAVIFPQAKQPGKAQLKEKKGEYTLKNELLTAKFINQNGKLTFAGSPTSFSYGVRRCTYRQAER